MRILRNRGANRADGNKPGGGSAIPAWLRFALSIIILCVLFTQISPSAFLHLLAGAKPGWLAIGLALMLAEPLILSFWWSSLLRARGYNVSFPVTIRISLMSDFLGFVMPSTLGSDIVKVAGLARYISSGAEALSSLLAFRIINYALMFGMALFAVLVFPELLRNGPLARVIAVSITTGFIIGGACFVFAGKAMELARKFFTWTNMPGAFEKLEEIRSAFRYFRTNPRAILNASLAGFVIQFNRTLYMYIIAVAIGVNVELGAFFIFVPIVTAVTMIPVSISGIGVREGGYVLLFGYLGVAAERAFSMSIIGFAISSAPVLAGAVIYWAYGFPNPSALDELQKGKAPL